MYIIPLPELVESVNLHPDPGVAVSFQEERIVQDGADVD